MKTKPFDKSTLLDNDEVILIALNDAIAEGDIEYLAVLLADIAKIKGMSNLANETGLNRESLYKALSGKRKPRFETIAKVLPALGYKLEIHPQ